MKAHIDDMEMLNHEIRAALESGCFTRARDLCDRWDHLAPDQPNPLSEKARQLADAVDAGAFGEQGVREVLRILEEIQHTEHARTSNTAIRSSDRPDSFLYERTIHASAAVASKMNWHLADRVTGSAELMADPGLRFMVAFLGSIPRDGNA